MVPYNLVNVNFGVLILMNNNVMMIIIVNQNIVMNNLNYVNLEKMKVNNVKKRMNV